MAELPLDDTAERTIPVVEVTPAARSLVLEARSAEPEPERLALYIEVGGANDGAFTYDMWFASFADAAPSDAICHHDDLPVVVIAESVKHLAGATLDAGENGLVIVNPNRPPTGELGGRVVPESDLDSPLELAVMEVLENEVNPQIAMHGGRADLVAVDDGVAYLRLSGGCQGCGLAQVTLSQGISVAIKDAVPEIVDVVDVTAHSEGSNPYMQSAKK